MQRGSMGSTNCTTNGLYRITCTQRGSIESTNCTTHGLNSITHPLRNQINSKLFHGSIIHSHTTNEFNADQSNISHLDTTVGLSLVDCLSRYYICARNKSANYMAMLYHGPPWMTIQYWQNAPTGWQSTHESGILFHSMRPKISIVDCKLHGSDILGLPIGLTSSIHWLSSPWVGCTMSPHGADKITSFLVKPMGWIPHGVDMPCV